jgi:hypothetical protein
MDFVGYYLILFEIYILNTIVCVHGVHINDIVIIVELSDF